MRQIRKWGILLLAVGVSAGLGWGGLVRGGSGEAGGAVVSAAAVDGFWDTRGHWGEAAIGLAVGKGYVDGYEDGTFRPDRKVTRAEFIKLVLTAIKIPVSDSATGSDWYVPYVNAAVSNGLHHWSDFTSGDWNTPMTRLEMARIAVRAIGEKNEDVKKWMYLATKAGLIQGTDDTGTLDVEGTTTRAQSVTIIERILDVKAGKTLEADKHAVSRAEVEWHRTNVYTMWPRYFGGQSIDELDLNKFQWDSSDGIYHEEVEYFVVVDMEDPLDPFLGEIEGMPFAFDKFEGIATPSTREQHQAPKKSYVTYSKVKQVIKGQFPKDLWVAPGGDVRVSPIVPKDVSTNERKDWKAYYSQMETSDTLYFSKYTSGQEFVEWNIKRGNNPVYLKNIPSTGGTYYWISGQVHPKGDNYSQNDIGIYLSYTPSVAYMNKYGPQIDNKVSSFMDLTDYNKHNDKIILP